MSVYRKPLPTDDPLMAPFWRHAKAHRLSVQCCRDCGDKHFPPGPVCPKCLSNEQDWEPVSGRAALVSWVRFHRAYWEGFVADVPYDVCLVALEEGPLLVSNFAGPVPDDPKAGLSLEVVFEDVSESFALPKFKVAS